MAKYFRFNGILTKVEKFNRSTISSSRVYIITQKYRKSKWFKGKKLLKKKIPSSAILTSFEKTQETEELIKFNNKTLNATIKFNIINPSTVFTDDIKKEIIEQSLYILESQEDIEFPIALSNNQKIKNNYQVKSVIFEKAGITKLLKVPMKVLSALLLAPLVSIGFPLFLVVLFIHVLVYMFLNLLSR